MLQAAMSKSKVPTDARSAEQTELILLLLSLFQYDSNYFYYHLHYFKTGNSYLVEYLFIAEKNPT